MKKRCIAIVIWDDAIEAYKEFQKDPSVGNMLQMQKMQQRLKLVKMANPHCIANGGEK